MDKLIELIDKHQKEIHGDYYLEVVAYRDGIFWSDGDCTSSVMDEIHLISKPYGFIKWLVENDKIDRPKVWLKIKDLGDDYGWFAIYSGIHIECLIMLLSISDTPIEDLISYLK